MTTPRITTSAIDAITAELRLLATRAKSTEDATPPENGGAKPEFADALKASLEHLNSTQLQAQKRGESFALGDESVHLSDVMIALQKANIALHTAVQVRNKFVSAYQEIMNMQI